MDWNSFQACFFKISAEEIAALNLAKYRKAQQQLEETEERANFYF